MDLMTERFNDPPLPKTPPPPMGRTENNSATYLSSGNPCLDFFFQVVPDTKSKTITRLLKSAWDRDPLKSLKLVCHLRGVRGTGKSDREGFYSSALWIHDHHPKTLALNVASIAGFGYIKDLPEILHRILNGADVREVQKRQYFSWKSKGFLGFKNCKKGKPGHKTPEEVKAEASAKRKEKREKAAAKALERYARDPNYRLLYDLVSDFFAESLVTDLERLRSGKLNEIGLAAKWCPSLYSPYDCSTLLCEGIATRVFPVESYPEYAEIEEAYYVYRVRDRLRKEVLVPLRAALELPEVYMAANKWGSLPYERVASVAMKNYKCLFMKHDGERFGKYLESVRKGEKKIAAGALLPHEILAEAYDEEVEDVAELQWRRMVSDLQEKGKLRNCIAVCDVSGSMEGTPMDVCVALGMLVAELSEEPWKGKVITFSARPQLHVIKGDTLAKKMCFVKKMDWGMNTDFQAVFDRILEVAVEGRLEPERMIKRVFVFSDMEFDEASRVRPSYYMGYDEASDDEASVRSWETDYMVIRRKYEEKGYGSVVPEIVFWNLRDSQSIPVTSKDKGVALVSGFSKNMIKVFLERDGVIDPEIVMDNAIAGEEYSKLVVFD
ncbi:hypothetical protein QJS04_geneDACA024455 [Acorus gramineus]|uniref:Uncharacterized protein n=1 Tax=Acorus gramineus TaxID=55184 RepID=A0AAV8ZXP9_ACOGR|nr:hypothetical protein QJS04_geneDACA024455 [Acorus gramineus]